MTPPNARAIALRRLNETRRSRKTNHVGGRALELEIISVEGELAFARLFGFAVETVAEHQVGTPNFVLADGSRVDVRTTARANPAYLVAEPDKAASGSIDVYALMQWLPARGEARCLGWTTAEELADAPCAPLSAHAKPTLNFPRSALRPLASLLDRHVPRTATLPFEVEVEVAPRPRWFD